MSEGHSHVWTINQFFGWVGGGITSRPGVSRTSITVRLISVRSQTTDGHARGQQGIISTLCVTNKSDRKKGKKNTDMLISFNN